MSKKSRKRSWNILIPSFLTSRWILIILIFLLLEVILLGILVWKLDLIGGSFQSTTISPWENVFWNRNWKRLFWKKQHKQKSGKSRHGLLTEQIPIFHHSALLNKLPPAKHHSGSSLDNFYSRSHISTQQQRVPFVIIGGSDGSGTRAFVQALQELGVTMIADAWNTMDIHGEEMNILDPSNNNNPQTGWPPLVQLVLNATHSANYQVQDLPTEVRDTAIEALQALKASLLVKGKDAQIDHPNAKVLLGNAAANAQYGWKAPISMVLLPLIQHVMGPIKFIHVVRDGRDIALSDNQSPVTRYYRTFYQKGKEYRLAQANQSIHAMQLWNDWNYQVLQWEQTTTSGLDYVIVRSEDLIDNDTRLDVLIQLAEFVGARVTLDELCCLSQKAIQDLGASKAHQLDGGAEGIMPDKIEQQQKAGRDSNVRGRYGKWSELLKNDPEQVNRLNKVGTKSLQAFGYEPWTRFLDTISGGDKTQSLLCPKLDGWKDQC